ncbi:MAG TPA: HAMP domain-containing sensor histidine kinase [Thermomicrobiales bacterium]|nr:HAMP domain-containing sensor histidine kinase [Thermomicrobiales bacterium]
MTSPPAEPADQVGTTWWTSRAMLTHELEGSVATIRAVARLLARSSDGPAEHVRGMARVLLAESDRLGLLADDSRSLRGERRRVNILRQPLDLNATLDSLRSYARLLQPGRPVGVALPPTTLRTSGCPIRLEQVLRNLIDNALRYTPRDRPIDLRLRCRAEHATWAEISVIDHGPGIAPDQAERVFQPHYRAATSDGVDGSGLGLALCRTIVENMGGWIWHEPTSGGGATFTLVLPRLSSDFEDAAGTN